jgi:hypothetical protein
MTVEMETMGEGAMGGQELMEDAQAMVGMEGVEDIQDVDMEEDAA